jgi:hypothetical protein
VVTITVINAESIATDTHLITVNSPLTKVRIDGPVTGTTGISYPFEVTARPVTATRPITYTWQATGHSPVTRTLNTLTDTLIFTWNVSGTQAITVTALNPENVVTATHLIAVKAPASKKQKIYLPVVFKK